jgi:DNA polymerase II small subunit
MEKPIQINIKSHLINKFAQAGINLTPPSLKLILDLDDPIQKGKKIIEQSSTIPEFSSHITLDILQKIDDKEIHSLLKDYNEKYLELTKENSNPDISSEIEDLEQLVEENLAKELEIISSSEKPTKEKPVSEIEKEDVLSDRKEKHSEKIKKNTLESIEVLKKKKKSKMKEKIPSKSENKIHGGSQKSLFSMNAIAKDYDADLKILRDPTGQIWTSGDYEDFYDLMTDKFNKLKSLMKKRPGASAATNIINLKRLNEDTDVTVMGLIDGIRQTKNGHHFMTLEDTTGNINVLIKKYIEPPEFKKTAEGLINDQMILIKGLYRPGEKGKRGIIFAEEVYKIDIPMSYEFSLSEDPLSVALLSDLHVGSREFEEKLWHRFIDFLHGRFGSKREKEIAGRIKYIIINGDLVDGIGVYPNQENDLVISDIYKQYEKVASLLAEIPDYIKIIYSPGNHEPVRNAIPRPAIDKKYTKDLLDLGVECVGNPSLIQTHNVKSLVFHGDSLLDLNLLVPGLENNRPEKTMKELLICRHLAPIYGKKTQIAPTSKDWLVVDEIPAIFHCGHIHINGLGEHRGVQLVNSGCFQAQTEFMKSFGIQPTPGIVPVVELDTLNAYSIKLK